MNAAAFSRRLPVRALRRLADIALQYAQLGAPVTAGATQRDALFGSICAATGRPGTGSRAARRASRCSIVVGAALQWNEEERLAHDLGQLASGSRVLERARSLGASFSECALLLGSCLPPMTVLHHEYRKTISQLSGEAARAEATTPDAMLDELYQISAGGRTATPSLGIPVVVCAAVSRRTVSPRRFVADKVPPQVTLNTLAMTAARTAFCFSINVGPSYARAGHRDDRRARW